VYLWCGEWDAAQDVLEQLLNHTHWPVLKPFHSSAAAMQGALRIGRKDIERGTAMVQEALQTMRDERQDVFGTSVACWAADGLTRAGRLEEAFAVIYEARRDAVRRAEAALLPEMLRVQAHILFSMSEHHESRAVRLLDRSRRIARRQSALSWELRTSLDLARIRARQGDHAEASQLLSGTYGRFSEGFATYDLQSAAQLLRELDPLASRAAG
jgi:predicted ATPase